MKDLKVLSEALDSRFQWGGFRFGWDGLIGLVPVVGDLFTGGASLYIVVRAFGMGLPLIVILKMLLNIGIETLVSLVPFLGNIFDFFWRSNLKNLALIMSYQEEPDRVRTRSWLSVGVFAGLIIALFLGLAYGLFRLFEFILQL